MTILCHINDIEDDSAQSFDIDDRNIFVVKKFGKLFVYLNSCPHIGIPLEFLPNDFLDNDKRYILCSNHGALFEIENGDCIAGPCVGQPLEAVPFKVEDGNIRLL